MCQVPPGLGGHLLGWVEAFPTTNKRAQTVSELFLWEIIRGDHHWFGVPFSLQSDNSPEFTSQVSQILSKALDSPWHFHIPYHPQSSGKVERTNCSLKTTLVKLSQELHLDWVKLLPDSFQATRSPQATSSHFTLWTHVWTSSPNYWSFT
jgi:transposase InsO family protein